MTSYTLICLGHDGGVASVHARELETDVQAVQAAHWLFRHDPEIRAWPNCRYIEIYQGVQLVQRVERGEEDSSFPGPPARDGRSAAGETA